MTDHRSQPCEASAPEPTTDEVHRFAVQSPNPGEVSDCMVCHRWLLPGIYAECEAAGA
jgi:hypothetical protein